MPRVDKALERAVIYGWIPDGGYRLWGRPIGRGADRKSLMVFEKEDSAVFFNAHRLAIPVKITIELAKHGIGRNKITWSRKPGGEKSNESSARKS